MSASVRIEDEAFSDSRYAVLARSLGLADVDHAIGKMARVWRQCTLEHRYSLPQTDVQALLGDGGVEALVTARLGELTNDGLVRICGTRGRIEWLAKLKAGGRKGGKSRASKAKRDKKGRLATSRPSLVEASHPSPGLSSPPVPAPVPVLHEREIAIGVDAVKQRLGLILPDPEIDLALSRSAPFTEAEYQAALTETKQRLGRHEPKYAAKVLGGIRDRAVQRQREGVGAAMDRAAAAFVRGDT